MINSIQGIVTKVQTTADECVRITIDIDSHFVQDINIIKWKNSMVKMELVEDKPVGK